MDNIQLLIIQGLMGIVLVLIGFSVTRIISQLTDIEKEQKLLADMVVRHREDTIQNYVRHEHAEQIKKDLMGRVDRLEAFISKVAGDQEHSVSEQLGAIRRELHLMLKRKE